jgi:protein-tyrosine-phosphatase
VVCHGSICRSPLAGYVIQAELGEEFVRIRGMKSRNGRAAKKIRDYVHNRLSETIVETLIDTHRSIQVVQEDFDWADLVVYMDGGNLKRIKEFNVKHKHLVCLAEFSNGECAKIVDPNYISAGPKVDDILDTIVDCASRLAELFNQRKNPSKLKG